MVEKRKVTVLQAGRARGLARPIVSRPGARGLVSIRAEAAVRSKGPSLRPWEPAGSIDVEQLVAWAYGPQKVERMAAAGLHRIEAALDGHESGGRSSDGCAVLADIEHLGCRIDRGGGLIKDDVHPAALAVAAEVEAIEGGGVVRHYGRLGVRPDGWREPKRWFRAAVWVKVGEEAQAERTGRGTSPMFCRVIPTVTRDELVRRRGEYAAWWQGLDLLAWRLSMRAMGFVVRQPEAPREPWGAAGEGREVA